MSKKLSCIGCDSKVKLLVCCNGCYQRAKEECKRLGAIKELENLKSDFNKISEIGYVEPKLVIETVNRIIEKHLKEYVACRKEINSRIKILKFQQKDIMNLTKEIRKKINEVKQMR